MELFRLHGRARLPLPQAVLLDFSSSPGRSPRTGPYVSALCPLRSPYLSGVRGDHWDAPLNLLGQYVSSSSWFFRASLSSWAQFVRCDLVEVLRFGGIQLSRQQRVGNLTIYFLCAWSFFTNSSSSLEA